MADQKTANTPPEKVIGLIRELTWLVEAAQENENISNDVIVGRGLYHDFGHARRAMARFASLGLVGEPDEHKMSEILLNNVVALLAHYGATVPPTAGLTCGTWQLSPSDERGQETNRSIVARDERTHTKAIIATLHKTETAGEEVVNGRALASVPHLLQIIKAYMADHACCAEEEPGEGCPCSVCEQGRALLATIYGRQQTSVRDE